MHVILGGAHNGKRAYVEKEILKFEQKSVLYFDGALPSNEQQFLNKCIIISQFEKILEPFLDKPEQIIAQEIFSQIQQLAKQNDVYCICTDTSRGVVPLEKDARQLRDTCGRFYQLLCVHAKTVTRVWYGISQQLKGVSDEEN